MQINYHALNQSTFNQNRSDYLLGQVEKGYLGYSTDSVIRKNGASGGVITQCLIYLLETKRIDGAVVLKQGSPKPWLAKPIIATTKQQILDSAQSVYIPIDTNKILDKLATYKGKVAYVGLPLQVAKIRQLQAEGDKAAQKISYVLGPYVGTGIELEAIKSYLRSNGVDSLTDIKELKYRDGEWPGYLRITLKDGREFRAEKFYYNYLIPFYVTYESLITVDFTNELTDISVGDAWNPKYVKQKQGFSVVLARSSKGLELLKDMKSKKLLSLKQLKRDEIVTMHAHMIDFKKRGSFIRIKWLKHLGQQVPTYDYAPKRIPLSRYGVELIISGIFLIGRIPLIRWFVEQIHITAIGSLFNFLRKTWKNLSKSTKRKGLMSVEFEELDSL
jgi:coenzyme F420 hydrogenase subunit beta